MADHHIDGAFFEKSIREQDSRTRKIRNYVGRCVQSAAEKTGRAFAIMSVS
jgi:hypothetical protein